MKNNLLEEGDVIELKEGHKVYADIPAHFFYANRRGVFTLSHGEIVLGKEYDYLQGRYIVYKVMIEGGGQGHGVHDIYPNGHHVYCFKADDQKVLVDFFQTGCFTAMIPDIIPVGRAIKRWVIEKTS